MFMPSCMVTSTGIFTNACFTLIYVACGLCYLEGFCDTSSSLMSSLSFLETLLCFRGAPFLGFDDLVRWLSLDLSVCEFESSWLIFSLTL